MEIEEALLKRSGSDEYSSPLCDGWGYVYFIHATTTRFVKIGWTSQLVSRLANLQIASPWALKVAYFSVTKNPRFVEAFYHWFYEAYACQGEWFELPWAHDYPQIEKNIQECLDVLLDARALLGYKIGTSDQLVKYRRIMPFLLLRRKVLESQSRAKYVITIGDSRTYANDGNALFDTLRSTACWMAPELKAKITIMERLTDGSFVPVSLETT